LLEIMMDMTCELIVGAADFVRRASGAPQAFCAL
jgi:hypothetical protein